MTAALVEEARGDRGAMRDLVDELVRATEEHPNYRVQYLSEIVRMHLAGGGTVESARALIPEEDPLWPRRLQLSYLSARAVVAEAADDDAGALAFYDEAAEGWGAYGFGLVQALSLMGAARALDRLERPQEARERLRHAQAIVADLGATHLLADPGRRSPRRKRPRSRLLGTDRLPLLGNAGVPCGTCIRRRSGERSFRRFGNCCAPSREGR